MLVVGEPGVGKSRVLTALADGTASGGRTVGVPARRAESGFEFSGVANFLHAVGASRTPDHAWRPTGVVDPSALFRSVQALSAHLQGLKLAPTLVLIDDLDTMDAASQTVLSLLSGHLAGTSLSVVATAAPPAPDSPLQSMPVIGLRPMSMTETMELAAALAPQARDSTWHILSQYVEGNPQVLGEVIAATEPHQLRGEDWLTLPPRTTPTTDTIALGQLQALDAEQTELLRYIALAPITHIGALCRLTPEATDLLDDLAELGFVRVRGANASISDPRVRMHLHWHLSPRERRERRSELAELTEPFDHHLASCARGNGPADDVSTDAVLAAGAHLVRHHRVIEGVELAERALARASDVSQHSEIVSEVSRQLLYAGEFDLSERYSGRVLPWVSDPHERLSLATLRSSAQLLGARRMADDEVHMLAALHASADHDAAAGLLSLAAMHRAERWEVSRARALLLPALGLNGQVSPLTRNKLTVLGAALDAIEGRSTAPGDVFDDSIDEMEMPPDLLLMRARTLTWRERYGDARRTFAIVLNHPNTSTPLWRILATYGIAGNEFAAGQFHAGREAVRAWRNIVPRALLTSAENRMMQAWSLYSTGQTEECLEQIEAALSMASRENAVGTRARALSLRGALRMLTEQPEDAVTDLRQVTTMSGDFRNPSLLRHFPDYVEACLATGRTQEAAAARRTLERRTVDRPGRWNHLARLRVAAMVAPEGVVDPFMLAVKEFGPGDSPYERGRTQLAFAQRLHGLGRGAEARRSAAMALASFEQAGAVAWAGRVFQGRGTVSTTPAFEQLSEQEGEIVRRVVAGERNREVALAMHLSVRTVELRLTHIYRTLGVRSRTGLIALHGSHPAPAARRVEP